MKDWKRVTRAGKSGASEIVVYAKRVIERDGFAFHFNLGVIDPQDQTGVLKMTVHAHVCEPFPAMEISRLGSRYASRTKTIMGAMREAEESAELTVRVLLKLHRNEPDTLNITPSPF